MKLIENIQQNNYIRNKSTIDRWQLAIRKTEDTIHPNRYALIEIYKDIMLDTHLSAQINLRKQKTLSANYGLFSSDGTKDQLASDSFNDYELSQTISFLLDSVYFGHSLIQIDLIQDQIKPILIPRENILPKNGKLLRTLSDSVGISYRELFEGQFIESIDFDNLGILNKCVPYILFKRFTTSSWAQFCEIFGMPLRIGKTTTRDGKALAQMDAMMLHMGSTAYGVIDHDDEVQFYESKKTDGSIYEQLIKHCNSEISKIINGAVIGEDSIHGSRSKEEVGERMGEYLYLSDQKLISHIINSQLLPIIGITKLKFAFIERNNLDALWLRTSQAMPHFDVDPDFISSTFGIPVSKKSNSFQNNQNIADFFA